MCTSAKYAMRNMTPVSAQLADMLSSIVPKAIPAPFPAEMPYMSPMRLNTVAVIIEKNGCRI